MAEPSALRRVLPALGLYFLSPLVAEFLLGNIPITAIAAYLAVSTMYGGGALLVRELARRAGYGWPSMITFALAFGVIEESFATMTLFNPNWEHRHQLDYGYLPALGISPPWTLFVLALHTVWSISVPIAIAETLARSRRTTPWLGKAGLAVAATLFVLGLLTVLASSVTRGNFVASPAQYGGAGLAVVAIIAVGMILGRREATAPSASTASARRAPNPWLVGTASLAAGSAFMLLYATDPRGLSPWLTGLDVPPWTATVLYLALFTALAVATSRWSRRTGWSDAHRLALAGGALLTYAWHAFPWEPITTSPVSNATDLTSNAVLATATIALLTVAALRLPRR
ncbi:hypothetical protein [Nonomuraea sp. NPDC050643]|uniref:hypothetical protein n=1 Tax=Nonomuraea sp. NPDC050643 TaxID=3155660 RepID=UPI0033F63C87